MVKKPTREEAKELILKLFERTDRPVLIGPACLALGPYWSLYDTHAVFTELVMRGKIRALTPEETWDYDCPHGYLLAGVPKKGGTPADEEQAPDDRRVLPEGGEAHDGASRGVEPAVSQVRATAGVHPSEPGFEELCVGYPDD